MTNLKMIIYTAFDGAESMITWDNADVYQKVKKFLEEMGVRLDPISSGNASAEAEFAYLETEQQYDAMCEFTKTLKEEGKT